MSDQGRAQRGPAARPGTEARTVAVIEIGSTGIRMIVAAIDGAGGFKVLDRAGKPSRVGRDVFTSGYVSREAVRESIAVLSSYRELLRGYGLAPKDASVIATSALREAANRDTFVDRVALQTGFRVSVVEDIEENHLMYLGVQHVLQDERRLLTRSNAIILEVGGGSTEIMLLKRGRMAGAHSLHIGTLRIDEQVRGAGASQAYIMKFIEDNVRTACDNLDSELPLESIKTFIVIGSDARLAASRIASESFGDYAIATREDFSRFAEQAASLSPEDCVSELRIPWSEAEGLAAGLAVERLFLERTGAEMVVVPNVSIREGVLISASRGPDTELQSEMHRQVIASAASLGRKYRYDERHARHVSELCLAIYDELTREHGLGPRERLLLEAAAILHDIGTFIRSSGHHKHGEYIVANSEIFGLNRGDLTIVSNVVRYHRKAPPSNLHVNFIALPREDRVAVMKLAAILRVADALDRGHDQRVSLASVERREDRLVLRAESGESGAMDLSLERLSLAEKSDMFENAFGLEPVLA
ncbi:MAG TPA: HD domain-containing protein [Spirochaetia bacterium]|nr:HD domain-containing protein [Spirochaetia bacterium]